MAFSHSRFPSVFWAGQGEKGEKCLSCGVFPLMPHKWEDEGPVLMGNETISMCCVVSTVPNRLLIFWGGVVPLCSASINHRHQGQVPAPPGASHCRGVPVPLAGGCSPSLAMPLTD